MKAPPKFKIGDIVRVVSVPRGGNLCYIGYEFTIIKAHGSGQNIWYEYLDDFDDLGKTKATFSEEYLELSEICKSPLWQALT